MPVVEEPGFLVLVLALEAQRLFDFPDFLTMDPPPSLVMRRPDGLARFVEQLQRRAQMIAEIVMDAVVGGGRFGDLPPRCPERLVPRLQLGFPVRASGPDLLCGVVLAARQIPLLLMGQMHRIGRVTGPPFPRFDPRQRYEAVRLVQVAHGLVGVDLLGQEVAVPDEERVPLNAL